MKTSGANTNKPIQQHLLKTVQTRTREMMSKHTPSIPTVLAAETAAHIGMTSRQELKQYKQQFKRKESKLSSHQLQSINHFNQIQIKPRNTSKLLTNSNKFDTRHTQTNSKSSTNPTPTNSPNTHKFSTSNTQNIKQLQNTTEVCQALQFKQVLLMLLALQSSIRAINKIQDIK